jgi:hypothetical protein
VGGRACARARARTHTHTHILHYTTLHFMVRRSFIHNEPADVQKHYKAKILKFVISNKTVAFREQNF